MLVSSFCASRLSDATRRMRATGLLCAAPSQQHYNLKPISTQLVVFVASLLEVLLAAPRGGTRRHLEGGRELRAASAPSQQHQLRRSSLSSVAAALAPSQQQQQATAVSRDHWAQPLEWAAPRRICHFFAAVTRQTAFVHNLSSERA